jgi:hypothetical protein
MLEGLTVEKDQIATAAVLAFVLIGIPIGALVWVCKASEPKEHVPTERESYPDDHFFI